MEFITVVYIFNATLLLLHEIESAFEREWEILGLPGKITGFLIMHIPIILLLFYGVLEVERHTMTGMVFGVVTGMLGLAPFLIHRVFVRRVGRFDLLLSRSILYFNVITGIGLFFLSLQVLL